MRLLLTPDKLDHQMRQDLGGLEILMCNCDGLRAVTAFSANANAIKASLCKSGPLVLISLVGIFVQPTWPSD